jgi:hypothetical protein
MDVPLPAVERRGMFVERGRTGGESLGALNFASSPSKSPSTTSIFVSITLEFCIVFVILDSSANNPS